jgi:hypothetical protein
MPLRVPYHGAATHPGAAVSRRQPDRRSSRCRLGDCSSWRWSSSSGCYLAGCAADAPRGEAAKAHPADASHLQPGLAPDRGQGVVDSAPTGAAAVGGGSDDGGSRWPDHLQMPARRAFHLSSGPLYRRDDLLGFLGSPAFRGRLLLQGHAGSSSASRGHYHGPIVGSRARGWQALRHRKATPGDELAALSACSRPSPGRPRSTSSDRRRQALEGQCAGQEWFDGPRSRSRSAGVTSTTSSGAARRGRRLPRRPVAVTWTGGWTPRVDLLGTRSRSGSPSLRARAAINERSVGRKPYARLTRPLDDRDGRRVRACDPPLPPARAAARR